MKRYALRPLNSPFRSISYEENLNDEQLDVVYNAQGPCLVLAGAGSGKTRVLIYRLAYLLEQGIPSAQILLVTFTNKAAKEMINRAEMLIKTSLNKMWAGTFHHIANKILRKNAHLLGYSNSFTIIDKEDAKDLIKESLDELGYDRAGKLFPKKEVIANIYSLSVNSQQNTGQIINQFYPQLEEFNYAIERIIKHYQNKKKQANLMDFDDLLFNWYQLLEIEEIKEYYSSLFRYILVDEYQDTNRIQFKILKSLCETHNNILAVGDDAQSIYSFRAANINNILDFPRVFPKAKIYKLQKNYRSSPQILNLANQIISKNRQQFPKQLQPVKKDGQLPVVVMAKDVYQQAQFVAQRALELYNQGLPLSEIAILFRSRFQALEMEVELLKRNIPYVVRGGQRFFEQAHIKDVMAYLKFSFNNQDELSFKRALSLHEGIGRGYTQKIWQQFQEGKNEAEIILSLPKKAKVGFRQFLKIINQIKNMDSPEEALRVIIASYTPYCQISFDNFQDRLSDLEEMAKMSRSFSSVRQFIIDINALENFRGETIISPSENESCLILSTIHQAKGLEWDTVFLIGFSDYEFPNPKALNSKQALEEERRLFYVAATRAKYNLYICYPQNKYTYRNGMIISRASMFLYELPRFCYEEWNIESF